MSTAIRVFLLRMAACSPVLRDEVMVILTDRSKPEESSAHTVVVSWIPIMPPFPMRQRAAAGRRLERPAR